MTPRTNRRQFIRAAALFAALPWRARAAGEGAPRARDDFDGTSAFPLQPVGRSEGAYTRKSEASMVERLDGSVLLAYARHTGRSDNDPAPIVTRILSPEGLPVSEEQVAIEPPVHGLNAMSPALQRLPDRRIGMLFSYRESVQTASRRFVASGDEGRTWSAPVVVAEGGYKTGCHDRFTVHSSGRLLAPCHCSDDWNRHYLHVRVSRSDDLGASWRLSEPIILPEVRWPADVAVKSGLESGCIEPGLAERRDGTLLMTIRTAMGTQFGSVSKDRGETWSTPRSLEVVSPVAPAHLSLLPGTDKLLLLWTSDFEANAPLFGQRHTIMAGISSDGGQSWPHRQRRVLVQDTTQSVDYPSVLYKGGEAWISLRVSTGAAVLAGRTSTCLMRVPLSWFLSLA